MTARYPLPFIISATAEPPRLDFLPNPMTFDGIIKVLAAIGMPVPTASISAAEVKQHATAGEFVRLRGHKLDPIKLDRALAQTKLTPEQRIEFKDALHETGLLS